jgi:DNA-binding MarR family transcriptional regulator
MICTVSCTTCAGGLAAESEAGPVLLSQRIMILANLLKRAATIRYHRLLDLRPGEWGIVAQLGQRAPRNLIDLATGMGRDKAQISRAVSRLVRLGLVTRKPNPRNSREILIALTHKGDTACQTILAAASAVNGALLAAVTPAQRRELEQLLDVLTTRAGALLANEQATTNGSHEEYDASD